MSGIFPIIVMDIIVIIMRIEIEFTDNDVKVRKVAILDKDWRIVNTKENEAIDVHTFSEHDWTWSLFFNAPQRSRYEVEFERIEVVVGDDILTFNPLDIFLLDNDYNVIRKFKADNVKVEE